MRRAATGGSLTVPRRRDGNAEGLLTVGLPISSFLPSLGGMEVGLHNIALRLAARGHRPLVFAPASCVHALRRRRSVLPYPVRAFPPKLLTLLEYAPSLGLRVLAAFLARAHRRFAVDVWHGTMGYPIGVALAMCAARRAFPFLVRCAGEDIQVEREIGYGLRLDPTVDRLVRRWLVQAPALVAITDSVALEYRHLGVPAERVLRIPNGVDLARFALGRSRAEVRRALGVADDVFVFLCVGRHHPKKGLDVLVRAAAELGRRAPELAFEVVIVGHASARLEPLVSSLGVGNRVRLLGQQEARVEDLVEGLPARALIEIYRMADAFVLPSLIETFGVVIIEAMAAGLPCIVTDAPGCRDIVEGGRHGLLVPPARPAELAEAMLALARDLELRKRLAAAARRRARDFDWDRLVEHYLEAYRGLLEGAGAPGRARGG